MIEEYEKSLKATFGDFDKQSNGSYIVNYEGSPHLIPPFRPFKSGQPVYIAQINTLAGVASKRYFVEQSWCNSEHQQEYVALGIIFDNKHDAENKCRELLGIPLIKTERDEFIEKSIQVAKESNPDFAETTNTKLAFGSQYDAGARFND